MRTCRIRTWLIYSGGEVNRGKHFMSTKRHSRSRRKNGPATQRQQRNRWVAWVTAALMLAAMAMYVISLDESMIP